MCGILTYLGPQKVGCDHPSLQAVAHRGPDASGAQSWPTPNGMLTLGHRRLSIIDLSATGAQPMQRGDLWVTYNGEIYNYVELRSELEQRGERFCGQSDTEVLLAAYRTWGRDCLARFNGMFAFVIWDARKQTLFAARDRFGVKPLYYWNSGSGFAVASETKQFFSLPGFQAVLNADVCLQYLCYGDYEYSAETFFQNVASLEPGHCFYLDLKYFRPGQAVIPQRWYDWRKEPLDVPEEEAAAHLRELVADAVKLRQRSDVPVGFGLSGGIDSSTITCVAAEQALPGARLQTFSSCYEEPSIDERRYIRMVVDHVPVEEHQVFLTPQFVQDHFDRVVYGHDIPPGGMTVFAHDALCQHSSAVGTKVILEGQGPDETMAGYREFYWAYIKELLTLWELRRSLQAYRQLKRVQPSSWRTDLIDLGVSVMPGLQRWRRDHRRQSVYFDRERPPRQLSYRYDSVQAIQELRITLLRSILHNVDRVSMAHAVEVRTPFLDYRIMEYTLALPIHLKIKDGQQKYILRQAMRGRVPQPILERTDKIGYPSPTRAWTQGPLRAFFMETLPRSGEVPWVHADQVRQDFAGYARGEQPYNPLFWRTLTFGRWFSLYRPSVVSN
jgi:asparagine synthase (glutamine-hydrolysing)